MTKYKWLSSTNVTAYLWYLFEKNESYGLWQSFKIAGVLAKCVEFKMTIVLTEYI